MLVCWANVGKSPPCHITLLEVAHSENVDIICAQEPYSRTGTKTSTHPGYDTIPPVDSWDEPSKWETERPRVMTYVRKGVGIKFTPKRATPHPDRLWTSVNGI